MKVLALLVALLSLVVLLAGNTALHVVSTLDVKTHADSGLLLVGDLRPVFRSDAFRGAFPHFGYGEHLLAWGPLALMVAVGIGLIVLRQRYKKLPAAVLGMVGLFAGALPYAVGFFALRGNTVPEDTGPWMVWMLLGPMYAAVIAVLLAVGALLAKKDKKGKKAKGGA